jgi:hypothetical protein
MMRTAREKARATMVVILEVRGVAVGLGRRGRGEGEKEKDVEEGTGTCIMSSFRSHRVVWCVGVKMGVWLFFAAQREELQAKVVLEVLSRGGMGHERGA